MPCCKRKTKRISPQDDFQETQGDENQAYDDTDGSDIRTENATEVSVTHITPRKKSVLASKLSENAFWIYLNITWIYIKELFQNGENSLRKRVKYNQTYPFYKLDEDLFMIHLLRRNFVYSFILFLVFIPVITVAVWFAVGTLNELIVLPIVAILLFFAKLYYNRKPTILMYDRAMSIYEIYFGEELLYQGHTHNLYIRLSAEGYDGCPKYYCLVLDAYHLLEMRISGFAESPVKLMQLGKKMAKRLGITFADYKLISNNHEVRSKCPHLHEPEF